MQYLWETSDEINMIVANNVKRLRKRLGISQSRLSEISGVSLGSIKRFERSGNISLLSLTKLAMSLDSTEDIKMLFTRVPYKSIEEVIRENK